MADVFSKKKRSDIMARIRSKNTGIEKAVFSDLRRKKIYFQKHYTRMPGKPDIALPTKKLAVFINGDFWHGYEFSKWRLRIPKNYWRSKIAANIERDKKNYRAARNRGWRILKVWGHEIIERPEETFEKISLFLKS